MTNAATKRAVSAAYRYIRSIVGEAQAKSIAADEVEYDERKQRWRVVVSFIIPPPKLPGHVLTYPLAVQRERRLLFIDGNTLQVTSMKRVAPPNE